MDFIEPPVNAWRLGADRLPVCAQAYTAAAAHAGWATVLRTVRHYRGAYLVQLPGNMPDGVPYAKTTLPASVR
jgi:hypothetical protein